MKPWPENPHAAYTPSLPADDRVCVGRHVVKAGPGARDRDAGSRWISLRKPAEPVLDQRLRRPGHPCPSGAWSRPSPAGDRRRPGGNGSRTRAFDHREILGQSVDAPRVRRAADERPDRGRPQARASSTAGDHEHVRIELACVRELAQLDSRPRIVDQAAGDGRGIGDAVLAADHRGVDVIDAQAGDRAWIDVFDRNPQLSLEGRSAASSAAPSSVVARNVADLLESGPKLAKNRALDCARRTSGAVVNCCRTPPIALPVAPDATSRSVAEDDPVVYLKGEVVRDARPDRAGAGYDDSSHRSTSARSSAVRPRNGGRTSS